MRARVGRLFRHPPSPFTPPGGFAQKTITKARKVENTKKKGDSFGAFLVPKLRLGMPVAKLRFAPPTSRASVISREAELPDRRPQAELGNEGLAGISSKHRVFEPPCFRDGAFCAKQAAHAGRVSHSRPARSGR